MKRQALILILVAATSIGSALAAEDAPTIKLTGSYRWNENKPVAMEAYLTPVTGVASSWTVKFQYMVGKELRIWDGNLKGDLKNGEVTGMGTNGKRSFDIKGKAVNGVINFNHAEIFKDGSLKPTGTGILQLPS